MKFKRLATIFSAVLVLSGCGSMHSSGKDLNISLPLKTKSIAPYETDVPVRLVLQNHYLKQMIKEK